MMLSYDAFEDLYDELSDADKDTFITSDPTLTIWFLHERIKEKRMQSIKYLCSIIVVLDASMLPKRLVFDSIDFAVSYSDAEDLMKSNILNAMNKPVRVIFVDHKRERYANYGPKDAHKIYFEFWNDKTLMNIEDQCSDLERDPAYHNVRARIYDLRVPRNDRRGKCTIDIDKRVRVIDDLTIDDEYIDKVILHDDDLILKFASKLLEDVCYLGCTIIETTPMGNMYHHTICNRSLDDIIKTIKNKLLQLMIQPSHSNHSDYELIKSFSEDDFDIIGFRRDKMIINDCGSIVDKLTGRTISLKGAMDGSLMTSIFEITKCPP